MAEETLRIDIDLVNLTIGDVERLESLGDDTPVSEVVDILDKAVVGDVRDMPVIHLGDILAALRQAIDLAARPGAKAGGGPAGDGEPAGEKATTPAKK